MDNMQKPSYLDTHGEFEYRKKLNECGYRGCEIDEFFKLLSKDNPPSEEWAIELAKRGVKTADFIHASWERQEQLDEMLELKELLMRMGYSEIEAERMVSKGISYKVFADFVRAGFYPTIEFWKLIDIFEATPCLIEHALSIASILEEYGHTKDEAKDETIRLLSLKLYEIEKDKRFINSLKDYIARLKDEGINCPYCYEEWWTRENFKSVYEYLDNVKRYREIGFSEVKAEWITFYDECLSKSHPIYITITKRKLHEDAKFMSRLNAVKFLNHMELVLKGMQYEKDKEALTVLIENIDASEYLKYKLRKAGYPEDFVEAFTYYKETEYIVSYVLGIRKILQFAKVIKDEFGIENFVKVYNEAYSGIEPFIGDVYIYDNFSPIKNFSEYFELGIKNGWMIRRFVDNGITAQELKSLMSRYSIPYIYEVVSKKGREGYEELVRKITYEKTVSLFKRKS